MFTNIRDKNEFLERVGHLWGPECEELEIIEPDSIFGWFFSRRIEELLVFHRANPDYHIISCLDPGLYVNACVPGALWYYLGEGDANPRLIHDKHDVIDAHYIQSLNSGRSKRNP